MVESATCCGRGEEQLPRSSTYPKVTMAVSADDAFQFLEKVGVVDGRNQLAKDPLACINALIRGFSEHLPFQTLSLMATPEGKRKVPSLQEVVEAGLRLEGGLCFSLNAFMCLLLKGLGLHAEIMQGTHLISNNPNTHPVTLLKDLRFPGDAHIIDVGGGYPMQEAVAVADLPAEYCHIGHKYRFQRQGDTVHIVFYIVDHTLPKSEQTGEWRNMFEFNLNPVDFSVFYPFLEAEYMSEDARFLHSLRAVRFPKEPSGGQVMAAIVNHSLLLGPGDDADKTKISDEDLPDTIRKHFPNIPPAKVDLAVARLAMLEKSSS